MKEWDLESYQRKFAETLTVFKRAKGLEALWVNTVDMGADHKPMFHVSIKGDTEVIQDEPMYYRFAGRIVALKDGGHAAVTRRFKKSWKIGLSPDNHILWGYGSAPKPWNLLPLEPLKIDVEAALKKSGPISEQLFVTPTDIYFLDKPVGLRKGTKFMVSESVWQEVSDSLRGFKCSISV